MTSRRNKLLLKMLGTTTGETEEKLLKLSIERIVADQAEYYKKFYKNEGPGAIIFMPQKKDKDSMFYLTVDLLIKAVNDANKKLKKHNLRIKNLKSHELATFAMGNFAEDFFENIKEVN